jgi:hypothetical protein
MDAFTSAALVLLICSPDSEHCREVHSEVYASVKECRAALPDTLRKFNQSGPPVIGRCVLAEGQQGVDPIITGSVSSDAYATVRVTRMENGRPLVSSYIVPKSPP